MLAGWHCYEATYVRATYVHVGEFGGPAKSQLAHVLIYLNSTHPEPTHPHQPIALPSKRNGPSIKSISAVGCVRHYSFIWSERIQAQSAQARKSKALVFSQSVLRPTALQHCPRPSQTETSRGRHSRAQSIALTCLHSPTLVHPAAIFLTNTCIT